ncbi:VanZ family protein [Desulfitispora alkaliphila]|uniref:VanZ family protein n=1 Tax=Desulfitispora alkaliphila TaxID=622674 RepID=UPI003D1A45F5
MKKSISWAAVILWMVLIFYLSHQPAPESNELSKGITKGVVNTTERVAPNAEFDIRSLNHIIRKNAHFFAYFVLGLLVINALRVSGVNGTRSLILALGICVLYAVSDEVHQLFIPGRSGELRDVLIDSAGASVGIGVYMLVSKRRKIRDRLIDIR